jgi:hypothetical protein
MFRSITTNWMKVAVRSPSAMMFIHYSTSPECNKFISNTRLYMKEKKREMNTEQNRREPFEYILISPSSTYDQTMSLINVGHMNMVSHPFFSDIFL